MSTRTPRPAPGTLITDPDALGFTEYVGVHVTMVGDDGEQFLALGHDDPAAIAEAFRRAARGAGWYAEDTVQLDADRVKRRYGAFTAQAEYAWWCDWSATQPAPGLIAVSVLEL